MITCDGSVNLYGLPPLINNLVSCHKCIESTAIPFIGLDINNVSGSYDVIGLSPYDLLDYNYKTFTSGNENYNI